MNTYLNVRNLEILVAGEPGNGKNDFIKAFLTNFPPSAEFRTRHATVHSVYLPDEYLRMQLHDFKTVDNMDSTVYDKVDVVLFHYDANDPESPKNLEKWISLMGVEAKKEILSILLPDGSNPGRLRGTAKRLAQQANILKDSFGLKLAMPISSDYHESASKVLQIIMNELPPAEIYKPIFNIAKKPCEKETLLRKKFLNKI